MEEVIARELEAASREFMAMVPDADPERLALFLERVGIAFTKRRNWPAAEILELASRIRAGKLPRPPKGPAAPAGGRPRRSR